MTLTEDGSPAMWDVVHPAFTLFNPERETFASVWAPFSTELQALVGAPDWLRAVSSKPHRPLG